MKFVSGSLLKTRADMTDQDPITKLAMTPRSQKEAGIDHYEWKDETIQPATLVVILIVTAIAVISLLAVSV